MSLKNVMWEIRLLSYTDMMTLAAELEKQLNGAKTPTATHLADLLSKLNVAGPELTELEKNELKYLKEIFSRKRSCVIKADGGGFTMTIDSLPGSQVVGLTPRVMFPMLLDQIITMHALQRMK